MKIIACNCQSVTKHLTLKVQGDTGPLGKMKVQGLKCEETNNWKITKPKTEEMKTVDYVRKQASLSVNIVKLKHQGTPKGTLPTN